MFLVTSWMCDFVEMPQHCKLLHLLIYFTNRKSQCSHDCFSYDDALRVMMRSSKAFHNHLMNVTTKTMEKELRDVCKNGPTATPIESMKGNISFQRLQNFHWNTVMTELHDKIPVTLMMVKNMLPSVEALRKNKQKGSRKHKRWIYQYLHGLIASSKTKVSFHIFSRRMTPSEANSVLNTRMAYIVATILYSHNSRRYRLLPSMLSVNLWRQGATAKSLTLLKNMGLAVGAEANRRCVDNISGEFKEWVKQWKEGVSKVGVRYAQYCMIFKMLCLSVLFSGNRISSITILTMYM